jgi:hypothetical protein
MKYVIDTSVDIKTYIQEHDSTKAVRLRNEYHQDGPADVRVVKAELGKAGFSTRTVARAARSLGVELRRAVEGGRTVYLWHLGEPQVIE